MLYRPAQPCYSQCSVTFSSVKGHTCDCDRPCEGCEAVHSLGSNLRFNMCHTLYLVASFDLGSPPEEGTLCRTGNCSKSQC